MSLPPPLGGSSKREDVIEMEKAKKLSQGPPRVYEYVDIDGHTYWSFKKPVASVGAPVRLYNSNRQGLFLIQYLARLRQDGPVLWELENSGSDITE